MCTYSIVIEDNLAAKAEELLNGQAFTGLD